MKKKKKKKVKLFASVIIAASCILLGYCLYSTYNSERQNKNIIDEIASHYNTYVRTNKEATLYDGSFAEAGVIGKNIELTLDEVDITTDTKYFKIEGFKDKYYINYKDVDKIEKLSSINNRYKNYIVFNRNIVTNHSTSFYDDDGNMVYKLNESFDLPIIIKEDNRYGVEFNNRLLYVKSDDINHTYESHNTDKTNASGVGVLNYHAFYDENNEEEKASCTTVICHSKSQFKQHLDFLKENNILTITMNELEMYIDGKLQLPKSVVITIDDGSMTKIAIDMLTEYKMYATIFLVTSWFNKDEYYKTEYIELHSHTHDMHDGGKCPGGQGGEIKCLDEELIQEDLRQSREDLDGSTVFCFPFYEYNDYAIEMVKEAGFTMAFIGESNYSDNLVHVGDDKFKLRRFVIVTYTTMNDLENYFGQIN